MPSRRSDYHPKWELISHLIRNVRAGGCCEQCGVGNRTIIQRLGKANYRIVDEDELALLDFRHQSINPLTGRKFRYWDVLRFYGFTRIILTTAHLDRNKANNRFWNLKALCQRCHLLHDMPEHVRNRNLGIDHAKEHQLQLF